MMITHWLRPVLVPIHREGYPFIAIFCIVTLIFLIMGWVVAFFVSVFLTVWCVAFFRDPVRVVPQNIDLVIAPADGVVQSLGKEVPPQELELGNTPLLRISIFMSMLNVHVNRIPVGGVVKKIRYKKGAFFNANLDKASDSNERQSFVVKTEKGKDVIFVQIAGLVARRIVGFVEEGQAVQAGMRFGLIRFGSRVDVYLPEGIEPNVCVGQICVGGETILANLSDLTQKPAVAIPL